MAIKQKIISVSGVNTEYHRIGEATINYTNRKAIITVLSYLGVGKRDEEKEKAQPSLKRDALMEELEKLVANPTEENEARRIELSNQINALPEQTPEDVAPRNIFTEQYEIELPSSTDFNLEFAYGWLKENAFTSSQDC